MSILDAFGGMAINAALPLFKDQLIKQFPILEKIGALNAINLDKANQQIHLELDAPRIGRNVLTLHYTIVSATRLELQVVESSAEWVGSMISKLFPTGQNGIEVPELIIKFLK